MEIAQNILLDIPFLEHITISYDLYHSEYIEIDRIRNAVMAAESLGRTASIRASMPPNPTKNHRDFLNSLKLEFKDRVHTQEVLSFGRATDLDIEPNYSDTIPTLPCLSSGPHVTENGSLLPCCSTLDNKITSDHPLNIGNAENTSLTNLYEKSEHNVLLNFIRLWGFPIIMDTLVKEFPDKYSGMKFVDEGQCNLCATLMHDSETVSFLKEWIKDINVHLTTAAGAASHFGKEKVISKVVSERKLEIIEMME